METIKINMATVKYQDKIFAYPILFGTLLLILILSVYSIQKGITNQLEIREYEKKIIQTGKIYRIRQKNNNGNNRNLRDGEIKSIENEISYINSLITLDSFPWGRLLDSLENSIPSGITISNFNMSEDMNNARLQGNASSINDISVFLDNLNGSNVYQNSELISLSVSEEDSDRGNTKGTGPNIIFEITSSIAKDQI